MSRVRSTAPPYCLACYASLPDFSGASVPCPRCGAIHLRADRAIYWTRERKMRRIEEAIKLAIVVAIVGLYFLSVAHFSASGAAAGWVLLPLTALGMILWQTASRITRKPRYLNLQLTWTLVFVLFPAVPALLFLPLAVSAGGGFWGITLLLAVLGGLVLLPALWLGRVIWKAGPRLERWKQARVELGRELADAELASR